MALSKEDLQAISELMDAKLKPIAEGLDSIEERQQAHTSSMMALENNVMRELKLLSENLLDAVVRSEKLEEVSAKVEEYGNRIFALEQKVSNG